MTASCRIGVKDLDQMVDRYSNMQADLRKLTTHAAVRKAMSCQAFLTHRREVSEP